MQNIIEITGIKLYSYHGCLKEEAIIGGNYIVDVFIKTDFTKASKTDNLDQTIDYVLVNNEFHKTLDEIRAIVKASRLALCRNSSLESFVSGLNSEFEERKNKV